MDNFDAKIEYEIEDLFNSMRLKYSPHEIIQLRAAYDLAFEAHKDQKRKSGEPYIIHPIAVARIASEELSLDVNSVMAAFLHDVVEDTPYTVEQIKEKFGDDVAYLVKVLTKEKKDYYEGSSQIDNFKQMLGSLNYDIRALLIKLSDRLHNMRTLDSMRPEKQMKIAGETDYFYAPLANRLGLYEVKTELENLSLRFRCPQEYSSIKEAIKHDEEANKERYNNLTTKIQNILDDNNVDATITVKNRLPYSIWKKLNKSGKDIDHLDNRSVIRIVYTDDYEKSDKVVCLGIYSLLTSYFKEKPNSFINYIDSPKENGYQALHIKLLGDSGIWEEVHILSTSMVKNAQLGCLDIAEGDTIFNWIEKFKVILHDIAFSSSEVNFMESVMSSFYKDDIVVYTPNGKSVILPFGGTAIDFAFEISEELGLHALYARINGRLKSIKSILNRGDCVEVIMGESVTPKEDWLDHALSYKARRYLHKFVENIKRLPYYRCEECQPLPGDEVVGFTQPDGNVMLHKRNCSTAIRLASQLGDSLIAVDFLEEEEFLYPVTISIKAVDRYHLLSDLIECITEKLKLSIDSLTTVTEDAIVNCQINFLVHSIDELRMVITYINQIKGVDEV
ncbi:MAG: HD domain-containing protein, partial [Rikenellaceae bacterium]